MLRRFSMSLLLCAAIFAQIPQTIQYQGKLTDISGVGENAELDMRFRIFDVETDGDSLWAMTIADVPIVHGLFDVSIGPIDLPFDEQYWLEIVVDGNVLAPRVQLTTSPYAFRAAVADSFTGGISPWTQDTMVAHWDSIRGVPAGLGLPGGIDGQVQFNNGGAFGGSPDFIFDNSTGYVGIGSPGAWYPLSVYKSADMMFVASIENRSATGWGLEIRTKDTTSTRSSFEVYNDGIQNIWIRNSGKVGIGVDPTCRLDVAGKTKTTDFQMTTGATDGYILQSDASGNASWINSLSLPASEDGDWVVDGVNMYSAVSGNVGIGTTSPTAKLAVVLDNCDTLINIDTIFDGFEDMTILPFTGSWTIVSDAFEGSYSAKSNPIGHSQSTTLSLTRTTSAGNITFARRVWSESGCDFLRFYIDGAQQASWSGNLSWEEFSYPVTSGSHSFQWIYSKDGSVNTGSDCGWIDAVQFPESSCVVDCGSDMGFLSDGGSEKPSGIFINGNVGIGISNPAYLLHVNGSAAKPGGGSWTDASDIRLKDVHSQFNRGLEALSNLQPVEFSYKADNPLELPSDRTYIGLIAQDVQKTIPEAIERDSKGSDYLYVNNDPIIWTMLNAIKELKAENDSLRARIEALENK